MIGITNKKVDAKVSNIADNPKIVPSISTFLSVGHNSKASVVKCDVAILEYKIQKN